MVQSVASRYTDYAIPAPLRVVGDDEKGTQCLGYNRTTLFVGDINTETWPSRLGESRI
jgi:hypothetical protein